MAFAVKYRTEFKDINGVVWKTDFLKDNFAGAITTLMGGGDPLIFHYDNEADDVFDPIRESHCDISVYSDTNFALQDLYSIELLQFQVNIYADDVLYWWGYIEPQKYEEVYEPPPYLVTISCTDGLSALDTDYKNGDEYFTGRRYLSQIILDCLSKIGHTEFIEYVNIYEDTIAQTADDSPFDQILADTYVFRDHSCLEVLTEILQIFNAFIRQKDGIFQIIRPKELIGTTINGRHFTSYNTKTSVSLTPLQNIKRLGYLTDRWQVPGGDLMVRPPVHDIKLTQDYGNRESWIENYQFKSNTFELISLIDGYSVNDWIRVGAVGITPVTSLIPSETEGCLIYSQDTNPNHTKYIYQIFGAFAKTTTTANLVLEFEFMFYNTGTYIVPGVTLYIEIKDSAGTRWLKGASVAGRTMAEGISWELAQNYITCPLDSPPGITDWTTVKFNLPGLPVDGPYRISIFSLWSYSIPIYACIKNLRFYTFSTELSLKSEKKVVWKTSKWFFLPFTPHRKKDVYSFPPEPKIITTEEYTAENTTQINGIKLVNDNHFLLGDVIDADIDNIASQFGGSLVCNSGTPQVRVVTITLTGSSGMAGIYINGLLADCTFNMNLSTTAADFVTNHAGDHAPTIIVTSSTNHIILTGYTTGYDFNVVIYPDLGNLDGTISENSAFTYVLTPTVSWTGGGYAAIKLLQVIANEVRDVYNRPKQLIQMPIYEMAKTLQINTLGNFQDAVDLYGGAIRVFCMNRGTFDVRNRTWDIDLFEIGTGATIGGTTETADSTVITSDTTVITADTL